MKNTNLTIQSSVFEDNFSSDRGSIIFGDGANSRSTVLDSNFTRNYAFQGGVFFSQIGTIIKVINCRF